MKGKMSDLIARGIAKKVESQLADIAINVKSLGAIGNANFYNNTTGKWYEDQTLTIEAHDDTIAIISALSVSNNVYFPDGNYLIKLSTPNVNRTAFYEFVNRKNIRLTGKGAKIIDGSVYSLNVLTDIFRFIGCEDVYIDVNYEAIPVSDPNTKLGYVGSAFTYFENSCKFIKVDSIVNHARYGVRSGGYSNPSDGYCKTFDINIKSFMTGYPVALYLAEDVKGSVTADGIHRAVYLAGAVGVDLDVKFKNQYVVDIVFLMTDAKTGTGTSRGCKNIKGKISDMGSTVFMPSSSCAGIGLSRVDPDTVYSDIDIKVNVVSDNTIASTIGAFKVSSTVKLIETSYPFNWEQHIYLKNIKISGIIDRSKQTIPANTAGDIYFYTEDTYQHYATVSNISFSDLTIIPEMGNTRRIYFYARGLKDIANFNNFNAENTTLEMVTNATSETSFVNSRLKEILGFDSKLSFINSHIQKLSDDSLTNSTTINSSVSGGGFKTKTKQIELSLTGASTTWSIAIPTGSLVLGLVGRVTEAIGGATGYTVGIAGDTARFVNTNTVTLGGTFTPSQQAVAEVSPRYYISNTDIIVTAKTSNFTSGKLKLLLTYISFTAPTL